MLEWFDDNPQATSVQFVLKSVNWGIVLQYQSRWLWKQEFEQDACVVQWYALFHPCNTLPPLINTWNNKAFVVYTSSPWCINTFRWPLSKCNFSRVPLPSWKQGYCLLPGQREKRPRKSSCNRRSLFEQRKSSFLRQSWYCISYCKDLHSSCPVVSTLSPSNSIALFPESRRMGPLRFQG